MRYVTYEEGPATHPGKYLLKINFEAFPFPHGTEGSYNVFLARIAGLSYPDFLRMCRDICGAEIIGKHQKYPVPYFSFGEGLSILTKWLNRRAKMIMFLREHPYEFELDENGKPIRKKFYDGHIEEPTNVEEETENIN